MNFLSLRIYFFVSILFWSLISVSQTVEWKRDARFSDRLPAGIEVYSGEGDLQRAPFKGYYAKIDLKSKNLSIDVDTTEGRRLTPSQFYNKLDSPVLVINGTFFSFATNQNLNTVIHRGRQLAYGPTTVKGIGKDSSLYYHPLRSALGIYRNGDADVAWLYADSTKKKPYAFQHTRPAIKNDRAVVTLTDHLEVKGNNFSKKMAPKKWKVKTAIGGGPVLLQHGTILITNAEERMFVSSPEAKHPRTAIGYTADHHLIILSVEGRHTGIADGVSLTQEAQLLKDLGCIEALNLDGGGSSCMLIDGDETIKPSDATGQRPVPAVLYVRRKK